MSSNKKKTTKIFSCEKRETKQKEVDAKQIVMQIEIFRSNFFFLTMQFHVALQVDNAWERSGARGMSDIKTRPLNLSLEVTWALGKMIRKHFTQRISSRELDKL